MIVRIVLLFFLIIATKEVYAQESKIDSVVCYHFMVLDSAMAFLDRNDNLLLEYGYHDSMFLLEKVSRIKAERKHDYSAAPILTADLITKWKKWFRNNYNILRWDENRINREDYDIYTERIKPIGMAKYKESPKVLPECLK